MNFLMSMEFREETGKQQESRIVHPEEDNSARQRAGITQIPIPSPLLQSCARSKHASGPGTAKEHLASASAAKCAPDCIYIRTGLKGKKEGGDKLWESATVFFS